jgi:hypothetical protein
MSAILSLTESQLMKALGDFITSLLPAGVGIQQGQQNRAPEPLGDFVLMWPILRRRVSTNEDDDADCYFTGSIAGTTLTVSAVEMGALKVGAQVFAPSVAAGTAISALQTGSGGVGTYTVAPTQNVTSCGMACGLHNMLSPVEVTVQLSVQGPNSTDYSQIIAAALRDTAACEFFAASGVDIQPLFADDPRQAPFVDAEDQYETQWTIDAVLQANPVISTAQQFATSATLDVVNVDVTYPP